MSLLMELPIVNNMLNQHQVERRQEEALVIAGGVRFSIKFLTEIPGKAEHVFINGIASSKQYAQHQVERRQEEALVIAGGV